MKSEEANTDNNSIVYSCYHKESRQGEHFVPRHTLSYQVKGTLVLNDGSRDYTSQEGALRFIRRNQLLRFTKIPPPAGEFESVSLYFDQQVLKDFSLEYGITAEAAQQAKPIVPIKMTDSFKSFLESLITYLNAGQFSNKQMAALKLKEGLLLLLETHPEIKNILFEFVEPHKIDLEAFMNKNYHFNVRLERFAYLTGRSLATFKRDFEKIFHESPHKWLLHKRLHEAHYLLKVKGRTASDIYLDLGFEDLSHFSFAFKKQFGESPSALAKTI